MNMYCEMFKALSDENRISILKLLSDGEKCATEILEGLDITQPTLSHHMKLLCDCNIVLAKKHGRQTYYIISAESASLLAAFFSELSAAPTAFSERPSAARKRTTVKKKPAAPAKKKEPKKEEQKREERQTDIWLF